MALIGFSTGALSLGDFERGLELIRQNQLKAVELSALREHELEPLVKSLPKLDLTGFDYISVHAPSAIKHLSEKNVVALLSEIAQYGWPIIVHPDVIIDINKWHQLGDRLTIENNDRRKQCGQRCEDIDKWLQRYPKAGFCLDMGHAWQVDRTMVEAYMMLKRFGHRLYQLHISEVSAMSKHERLSFLFVKALKGIASHIPASIPVIIESVVQEDYIQTEIANVKTALNSEGWHISQTSFKKTEDRGLHRVTP